MGRTFVAHRTSCGLEAMSETATASIETDLKSPKGIGTKGVQPHVENWPNANRKKRSSQFFAVGSRNGRPDKQHCRTYMPTHNQPNVSSK